MASIVEFSPWANRHAFADASNPSKNDHSSASAVFESPSDGLFIAFSPNFGAAVSTRFDRAVSIELQVYVQELGIANRSDITVYKANEAFNANTLTYSDAPNVSYAGGGITETTGYFAINLSTNPSNVDRPIVDNGLKIVSYSSTKIATSSAGNTMWPKLVLRVEYGNCVQMEAYSWASTWGGRTITRQVDQEIIFGVPTKPDGFCYAVVQQTGISAIWRESDGAEEHEIPMADGTAQKIVIPPNTFVGLSSVQVRVKVYGNSTKIGKATDTWCTVLLSDSTPYSYPLSPSWETVDCTKPLPFRWEHQVSSGSAQTKAELQWSADKSAWTDLATVTGSAQSWTAPANTFTAGTRYWRVRTYNSDNVASAWSDAATFICVGAPAAPVVVIQELSPRPKISWQVEGQQAYQVELVGVYTDGTRFGTDKQWQSPLYLADGDYTVRVRVQNEYGFWSAWGVAPLQIINTPGSAITLTAEAGREVTLAWAASGFDYYIVYRDGTAIARTTEPLYTDRTSIGQVKYQVRGCYATSANYSLSDAVTVTVSTPSVCLYDLDAGKWVDLRYDASAHRSTAYSLARDIQYMQLSGRAYPVAERSEFVQRSLRVACVCFTAADRARMLSILGHLVCVKTPEGNMVMGYIANLSETSDDFFSTYGFDVAQADVKEAIDIDEA